LGLRKERIRGAAQKGNGKRGTPVLTKREIHEHDKESGGGTGHTIGKKKVCRSGGKKIALQPRCKKTAVLQKDAAKRLKRARTRREKEHRPTGKEKQVCGEGVMQVIKKKTLQNA